MANKYDAFLYETGSRIRNIRKKMHLTQMALAEKIGNDCSANMISCYENGENEMGLKRFVAISRALRVSPDELLGSSDKHNLEVGELFSQLNDENKDIIMKQMKAFLLMQRIQTNDVISANLWP